MSAQSRNKETPSEQISGLILQITDNEIPSVLLNSLVQTSKAQRSNSFLSFRSRSPKFSVKHMQEALKEKQHHKAVY